MKRYKVIDKTLPRYRLSKYRHNIVSRELFDSFLKKYPDMNVDWVKFKTISGAINEEYVEEIVASREGAVLPAQMGKIWCGLFPLKKVERVVPTDDHTKYMSFGLINGTTGKVCWDFINIPYKVKNHHFYSFNGHRTLTNKASNAFRQTPEIFKSGYSRADKYKSLILKKQEHEQFLNGSNAETSDKSDKDTK